MALFKREDMSSNMNPAVTSWGRLLLVGLGVLVVVALVVGTFMYGNSQRNQENTGQSQPQEAIPESGEVMPQQSSEQPLANGSQSSNGSSQSPGNQSSITTSPTTGPQAVPNTGPEDAVAIIATVIAGAVVYYRYSKRQLQLAQRRT